MRNLIMFIILCRFKIHVMVKDGTGEATLMLLHWTAQGIVPDFSMIHLMRYTLFHKLLIITTFIL